MMGIVCIFYPTVKVFSTQTKVFVAVSSEALYHDNVKFFKWLYKADLYTQHYLGFNAHVAVILVSVGYVAICWFVYWTDTHTLHKLIYRLDVQLKSSNVK